MINLFTPLKLRELTIPNRIFLAPMCQYSSPDGRPADWHLAHLGARAVGGAGLIMTEATAVSPEGRISPDDLGLWEDGQIPAFKRVVEFIREHGAIAGIQLAHAGRKASVSAPWLGSKPLAQQQRGWQPLAPGPAPFSAEHPVPQALTERDLDRLEMQFRHAAKRALESGFQVVEVHAAHGYLLHQFLSPLSNTRSDLFGGSLERRMAFPLRIAGAVREIWPQESPVFVRISATDWMDGGWDLEQSLVFCDRLRRLGIDLIDCSSGGLVPNAVIPAAPGFQVPFAARIKQSVRICTGAVGLITTPQQAQDIIAGEQADAVSLGRELLRNPSWPQHAARQLNIDLPWPVQYERAKL